MPPNISGGKQLYNACIVISAVGSIDVIPVYVPYHQLYLHYNLMLFRILSEN